jgi:hypothetical protein
VPVEQTVSSFREILEGKHDDIPERAFLLKGTIDEVVEAARGARDEEESDEGEGGDDGENGNGGSEATGESSGGGEESGREEQGKKADEGDEGSDDNKDDES